MIDRSPLPSTSRLLHWLAIAAAASPIALATLVPAYVPEGGVPSRFFCLTCGGNPGTDFVLNVLLFVPLGIALRAAGMTAHRVARLGFVFSAGIELAQVILPGRDPALRDILANGFGATLGAYGWDARRLVRASSPQQAARLGIAASAAAAMALLLGAWLMRPDIPDDSYFGQWAPRFRHRAWFLGTLYDARVNGAPLPRAEEAEPGTLARAFRRDSLLLEATMQLGPRTPDFAPIAAVVDAHEREVASLGQDGNRLVFRARVLGDRAGLNTPALSLWIPPEFRGDTLRVVARRRGGQLQLQARAGPATLASSLPLTPGASWLLLSPGGRPAGAGAWWVAALFVAFLYHPGAWWIAQVGTARAIGTFAALLAAGLLGAPLAGGGPRAPLAQWVAAIAGAVVAWVAARHR